MLSDRGRIVACPICAVEYVYELRQGEEVAATGRFSHPRALEVGDRVTIGGQDAIVRVIEPVLGEREWRLVAQLVRETG